jgi:hypothetical protein
MLIPIIFWVSFPLSLVVSIIGILKNRFWLVLIGAVLFLPISYYLNGSPTLHGLAILLPLFQVGSAVAVREGNTRWAWILLVPAFLMVIWFASIVLYYQTL